MPSDEQKVLSIDDEVQLSQESLRYNELIIHDLLLATEEAHCCRHENNGQNRIQWSTTIYLFYNIETRLGQHTKTYIALFQDIRPEYIHFSA